MKKLHVAALAALALAVSIPTSAQADDPVTPVEGAVCNLYLLDCKPDAKSFNEMVSSLSSEPAAATFVDSASDYKDSKKRDGVESNVGMWTGWLKQEKAGTYTFLCKRDWFNNSDFYRYSIWINGKKCAEAASGQFSFNVDLNAGFNSVKIVVGCKYYDTPRPLSITYKKAGSVKEPVSFGPENMFRDDEEE